MTGLLFRYFFVAVVMEQLQREVQSLTARLNALSVGGAKKTRRRRKRGAAAPAPAALGASAPAVVSVTGRSRTRRKKGRGIIQGGMGTITLARREYIRDVNINAAGAQRLDYFDIVPDSFAFLKQFKMFDRVKWNKLHLFYKPGVGANFNGFVSYGVLWGFDKTSPGNRQNISALTPNMSHAIWVDGEARPLVCPQAKLQTRPWFTPDDADSVEKGPGRVCLAAESAGNTNEKVMTVGELWADYSVTLTGSSF